MLNNMINKVMSDNQNLCRVPSFQKKAYTEFKFKQMDKQQRYFEAIVMAMQTFLEEEFAKGQICAELRLMKKIEAARDLYKRY